MKFMKTELLMQTELLHKTLSFLMLIQREHAILVTETELLHISILSQFLIILYNLS